MINGLYLFSGIGGISLALSPWVKPIAYCENDRYAQGVLLSRMLSGEITTAPIWDDVTTLLPNMLPRNGIDIIYGGFPCQDISFAGDGLGLDGERSSLFYEITRLCGQIEPEFIFLENVPAITTRGGTEVARAIAEMGYDCRWCVIPSGHKKDEFKGERWFLLAKAQSTRCETLQQSGGEKALARLTNYGCYERVPIERPEVITSLCGTLDGVSHRLHRIKHLGNAVVPSQARLAFKILIGIENYV